MYKLEFNTTEKNVVIFESDSNGYSKILEYSNIPTVKIEANFYEVMQKNEDKVKPIVRLPIANTLMIIKS